MNCSRNTAALYSDDDKAKNKSRIYLSVYLVEIDFNQHENINKWPDEDLPLEAFGHVNRSKLLSAVCSKNKKLRYREEHSASVVLSWCT